MAIDRVRTMTIEEYLAFDEQCEFKHEYLYGELCEMPGGTSDHEDICVNVLLAFHGRLDRSMFTVRSSGMRVLIEGDRVVFPDLSVVSGESHTAYGKLTLLNPALVVEVLSPSSITHDRVAKSAWYLQVASIQHYLIIDQFGVDVELLSRVGNRWQSRRFTNINDVIHIPALNCDLPLADVYDGIRFDPPAPG